MTKRAFLALAFLLAFVAPSWAAFPTVQTRTTSSVNSAGSTHVMNLPSGITAGDLLWATTCTTGNNSTIPPNGWTMFSTFGSFLRTGIFYRVADGTEGATVTFTTATSERSAHSVLRISGWGFNFGIATATGSSSQADPPNANPGVAADYLWIASACTGGLQTFTAPTNYTNINQKTELSSRSVATAERLLNASSENPGTFTHTNDNWSTATVYIPGGTGPASCVGFPSVATRATSQQASGTTTHTVSLPSGIASGDGLLAALGLGTNAAVTVTWPAGWTKVVDQACGGAIQCHATIGTRVADGSEGSTIAVTTSTSITSTHIALRVTGSRTSPSPFELAAATGGSTSPDPPSLSPTGGAKNYLWIPTTTMQLHSGQGPPLQYVNYWASELGTNLLTVSANKCVAAASENPGVFPGSTSASWYAATFAVHPAEATGTDRQIINTRRVPSFLDWFLVPRAHAAEATLARR